MSQSTSEAGSRPSALAILESAFFGEGGFVTGGERGFVQAPKLDSEALRRRQVVPPWVPRCENPYLTLNPTLT